MVLVDGVGIDVTIEVVLRWVRAVASLKTFELIKSVQQVRTTDRIWDGVLVQVWVVEFEVVVWTSLMRKATWSGCRASWPSSWLPHPRKMLVVVIVIIDAADAADATVEIKVASTVSWW